MSAHDACDEPSRSVGCAIITVSDTRTEASDLSGRALRELLTEAGHHVCRYAIVRNEPGAIQETLTAAVGDPRCQVVLFTGGTGVSPRDRTVEAVAGMLDRRLDGFGELFRMLSFEDIGPRAMLSRAMGGIFRNRAVLCLPGSTGAVRLAMSRLILPALDHLLAELTRGLPAD